jgi:hypothetical protein
VEEARRLRERIANVERNARGYREYGVELRLELVAFTQQRISAGGSASAAAKELGLNPATVIGWLNAAVQDVSAAPRMRRVEADDAPRAATRSELVLEIGGDVRVRGLRLEQLVELVRRLR